MGSIFIKIFDVKVLSRIKAIRSFDLPNIRNFSQLPLVVEKNGMSVIL